MLAHRTKILIPESHRVVIEVPDAIPSGPAELILLAESRPSAEEAQPAEIGREEAERRFKSVAAELAADPRRFHDLSREERRARLQTVMGIGRGLLSTSDEIARRKQEEIEIEDRHLGR
jgi:hypothetical protein